jgi:hypothetical protein
MQQKKKNSAVINDLFSQKVSPIIALKWGKQEDMMIENQPLCVKEVNVSGRNKMIQSVLSKGRLCRLY